MAEDMDFASFDDLLNKAEHLTAEIDDNMQLPRIERNIKQLFEVGQSLWTRTGYQSSRDTNDVRASVLLGSKGYDLQKVSQQLENLNASKKLSSIESSKVCLINASATGTELLKSLVLSGIGSFTIIDDSKISSQDDNNFFFERTSIGKGRAEISTLLLRELNAEVHGDYLEDSIETLLEANQSNVDLFSKFSVIIATNIHNERTIVKLSQLLWDINVPFIICYSIGFIGLIRVQIREHPIIESHPDNALEDLRLDCPFPGIYIYPFYFHITVCFNYQLLLINHFSFLDQI